jgi:hypothetical protein
VPYRVVMIGAGFGGSGMGVAPQPGRMAPEGQVRYVASALRALREQRLARQAQTSMYGCRVRHFDLSDFTLTPGRIAATAPGPAVA